MVLNPMDFSVFSTLPITRFSLERPSPEISLLSLFWFSSYLLCSISVSSERFSFSTYLFMKMSPQASILGSLLLLSLIPSCSCLPFSDSQSEVFIPGLSSQLRIRERIWLECLSISSHRMYQWHPHLSLRPHQSVPSLPSNISSVTLHSVLSPGHV